jgi:hypothetical protein
MKRHLPQLGLIGLAAFGTSIAFAAVESESNNTSGTANNLVVPFTTNDTGIIVTGKLREGNNTPNPRDQDFFKFTNLFQFTSIRVKITPSGIDGSQHLSFQILNNAQSVLFSDSFSSNSRENTITSTAPGAVFFVRIFDPGDLSSASGEASYSVEVVGVGGVNPAVAFAAKQAEVFAKQAEITAKEGEIDDKQDDIATWQGWITSLNAQIAASNKNLLKQKTLLKRAKLKALKAKIQKLIAKYSKQLPPLKSGLGLRNSQLVQINLDLTTLQDELTALQDQLATLQAELAALQALI